jgi:molybdate transport system regulatory protein
MPDDASRPEEPLVIRSKIWIERNDVVVLSDWRVELLEAIDAHGSLRRAAEQLDVPYRTAWDRVKATEAALGIRLLETASGGADGGGSHLTPQAREACRRFRRVSSGVQEVLTRRFQTEFQKHE